MAEDKSTQPKIEVCEECFEERKPADRKAPLYGWGEEGCPLAKPLCWEHWAPNAEFRVAYSRFLEKRKAHLVGGHLEGAKLEGVSLRGARLWDAYLSDATLEQADMFEANAWNVDFEGASLSKTDLRGAHLRWCNFKNADLRWAHLQGANLSGSVIDGARLQDARMWRCSFWFMMFDALLWLLVAKCGRIGQSDCVKSWALMRYEKYVRKHDLEHSKREQTDQKEADAMRRLEHSFRLAAARFLSVLAGRELKTPPQEDWPSHRLPVTMWRGVSGVDNCRTDDSMTTRYIKDVALIQEFRGRHPRWAFLWRWSCFYGQSFLLWAFWCLLVAFVFGAIYWGSDLLDLKGKQDTGFTHFYFSVVTFTTLGFGDIAPVKTGSSLAAEILVTIEVILGYIGLGGLISILANKVARRA